MRKLALSSRPRDLLPTQPDDLERDRTEIAVRLNLAVCMWTDVGGFDASANVLERARELSEKVGDDVTLFEILWASAFQYTARLDHQKAHVLYEGALRIAMRVQNRDMVGRARSWLGYSSMYEGNFIAAIEELEQADELSASDPSKRETAIVSWRIGNRTFASFTLWALGYPERAAATSRSSCVTAREKSSLSD
jgi:tetratricopeptide (TPR) repeat protein